MNKENLSISRQENEINKSRYKGRERAKRYFTIIPNTVINGSTAYEQSLYTQMKRLAWERGICFATQRELARRMNVSVSTVSKTLKKLIAKGWIKYQGKHKGKTRPGYEYRVEDIWEENNRRYKLKKTKNSSPDGQSQKNVRGANNPPKIVRQANNLPEIVRTANLDCSPGTDIIRNNINNIIYPSNFFKKFEGCGDMLINRKDITFKRRAMDQVAQAYQKIKGINPQGKEWFPILQSIKTMFMSGRRPEEIISFMKWLNESEEEWTRNWTINTVRLKLPEFLAGKLQKEKEPLIIVDGLKFYSLEEFEQAKKEGRIYADPITGEYHKKL